MLAGAMALSAGAQVAPIENRNVLDANPQVGSGGFNSPTAWQGGVNSQLYVTGQTTGLSAFRRQPYFAANELRLDVPSASLQTFERQSVGLPDITAGQSFRTQPFFSREQTVLGYRATEAGLTVPGSNMPAQPVVSAAVQQLYIQATADYRQIMSMPEVRPGDTRVGVPPQPLSPALVKAGPLPTDVFGAIHQPDKEELAMELYLLGLSQGMTDERVDTQVPAIQRERVPEATDRAEPAAETPEREQPVQPEQRLVPVPEGTTPGAEQPAPAMLPEANQDAYIDLLLQLRQQHAAQHERLTEPLPDDTEGPGLSRERPQDQRLVERTEQGLMIHSLAGQSRDSFNRYMQAGQQFMKQGKYYDARNQYRLASTISPDNPLAQVGQALALFATGEANTAGHHMRLAMSILPPLMEANLDLRNLVGINAIKAQLEEADKLIQDNNATARVVFIATYLHDSLNDIPKARKYAQMLKEMAGGDKLFQAYAHYVLTGELPGSQAQTRPATQP